MSPYDPENYNPDRYSASESGKSLSYRLKWWSHGAGYTFKKTLGVGMGIGGYKQHFSDKWNYPPVPHAHSLYFSFLFDFGVIGFFLMVFLLFTALKEIYLAAIMSQGKVEQTILLSFTACLIATGVHLLIDGEYNIGLPWFLLGLAMASANLINKDMGKSLDAISI